MIRSAVVLARPMLPGSGLIKEDERVLGLKELQNTSEFCVQSSVPGLIQVQAFGVNHTAADALLWADAGSTHNVSIRLGVPRLAADLSAAKAVCYQFTPSFRALEDARLERQPDGTYRATIKGADTPASCGLYGVTDETCVEAEPRGPGCILGTGAEGFELRRGFAIGRYSSIVKPVNGEGRLILDIGRLPRPSGPAAVSFPSATTAAGRLTGIWQTMLTREARHKSGSAPTAPAGESAATLRAAQSERDATVRRALWASYLSLITAHGDRLPPARDAEARAAVSTALRELTPTSPFWPLVVPHLYDAVAAAGLPTGPDGYAGDVVRGLAVPSARPIAIEACTVAAHKRKDTAALNGWLGWLLGDYDTHYTARAARERFGLNDKVQVGKPFPEFAVRSLDDPRVTLTAKSIGARMLLVDFWATWCAPCIAEIPGLQKAYDRYSARGFRILSYSLDTDPGLVKEFRRTRFPMPWLHTLFPEGPDGMTVHFGLFGIPAPVLIDAEGRVVAMRDELIGGKLEALLERKLQ